MNIARFSSYFLLHSDLEITLSQEKQPSHVLISFTFGTTIRQILAYLSLKFVDV